MEYRKVFLLSVVVFLSACAGKNVELSNSNLWSRSIR